MMDRVLNTSLLVTSFKFTVTYTFLKISKTVEIFAHDNFILRFQKKVFSIKI